MKAPVELIGTHTGTGLTANNTVHTIGRELTGKADLIADVRRIIQIVGINGSTIEIQASLDGANWTTVDSYTADTLVVMEDGPRFIRSNCAAYGTGTVLVYVQKFLENDRG